MSTFCQGYENEYIIFCESVLILFCLMHILGLVCVNTLVFLFVCLFSANEAFQVYGSFMEQMLTDDMLQKLFQ